MAGRLDDQLWRVCIARTAGVCQLSGSTVRRGDVVFRPMRRKKGSPAGAHDLILADRLLNDASDAMC